MADVNANIGVHIDASAALAELKNLQRQLATFHASIAKGSAASAMAQRNLQTNLLNSINATGQFTAQMGLVRTSTESFTHALEKNKLGMKEYFRYAGGATRTFGRLFKSEFDTIQQVAEERVKKMQTQFIKMGRDANGAMKAMAITPNALNMKDLGTQTQIAAQKQALFNQLVRQGSTNLLNFGKNTQWAGRQLMVGFTVPLAYLGTVASKTFMDLEKQAIRFRRVYGDMFTTTEDTTKALKEIELLAQSFTKYGVAVVDTMEMAADAAAMGKTGADLTAQVAQATRLAVLGSVEQQQALETTISLTNAFGIAAEDLTSKIDFLNSVENQTVVSIEDLTIAIPKAGPVVQQLGGDVEDLAFFLTAMKEGGINASEGANALKSGLASLINPSKKASAFLADLGVNINAIVEGNKGNIRDTVIDFSRALDTLDPLNRARAIEQLFGKFQFSRLSTLFQNVTKDGTQAARVLQLATSSVEELAILSERELKAVEDSVGTNFKAAVEELKLTLAPIGKEFLKAVTPIIKVVGDVLEKFNGLSDGTKKFIVIVTALVGLIGPTLLMTFGLLANGAANIIKLFLALRMGFMKLGGNSKILAEQTNYMTAEQLEAATVATSLNQAHTKLTQSFNMEAVAVKALRQAYVEATVAAANFARSNPGMMAPGPARGVRPGTNNLGQKPKGFSSGTTGLPGPRGAGDIIPILAAPGEAIIPSDVAQDPKFKPIISAMVNGTLQGFVDGTDNVQPFANSPEFQPKIDLSGPSQDVLRSSMGQVTDLVNGNPRTTETDAEFAERSKALLARMQAKKNPKAEKARTTPTKSSKDQASHVGKGAPVPIKKLLAIPNITETTRKQLETYALILRSQGLPEATTAHHQLMFDFPEWMNRQMPSDDPTKGVPAQEFLDEWEKRGPKKWNASKISIEDAKLMDDAFASIIREDIEKNGRTVINDSYIADIFENRVPQKPGVAKSKGYLDAVSKYGDIRTYNLGVGVSDTPDEARKILSAAVAQGLIQDFDIKEGVSSGKTKRAKVKSTTVTLNDGTVVNMNRFGGGARMGVGRKRTKKPTTVVAQQAENAESAATSAKRQAALEEVAARTKSSPVADQEPEQYARQLTKSSGYSFSPAPGIAGLYEKPDGTKVFVKPTMDYTSAIAEQRGTIIARDVHGLEAPEQTIKTMIDPTDETGQRKLIVLESPYDERFDESKMSRTFTKDEYVKQLLASGLRGDKDLKAGNLGGSVLADVGTAGVFNKATGVRDYSTEMPSVFEMMKTNVREVPGDFAGKSPFWFSNTTADVARSMTANEFAAKMDAEVARTTEALESTIKGFNLVEPPASDQSPQANNMRAEKAAYESMLQRLRDAEKQDWKEIHKLHTSIAVKPDELLQDDKTGELEKPKTRSKRAGTKSTGGLPDTRTIKEPKGKTVVQGTVGPKKTPLMRGKADAPEARITPGIRIVDAEREFRREQNSLRRQLEKLEKAKVVQIKRELRQQRKQSEIRDNLLKEEHDNIKKTIKAEEETRAQNAQNAKMQKQQTRMMRMQGVGMAAAMASGGAYMSGNTDMGHALAGVSGLLNILPLLSSPMAILATSLVAGTVAILKFNHDLNKAREEGANFAKSLSMTAGKLEELSVITKTTPATMDADRKRQNLLTGSGEGQRKFGQNVLESEFGKNLLVDIESQAKAGESVKQIGETLANNLAYAVIQGVATPEQAKSISAALGEKLGSYEIPAIVTGNLVKILGPNGENLAKDPLKVTLEIQKRSMDKQAEIFQSAIDNRRDTRTVGGGLALAGGAAAGLGALAATGIGAPIAAVASVALIGKALYDQNKIKAENIKLDAAATQMGIEQVVMNNGLVDSLNERFDIQLKTAKTAAEIKAIEDARAIALSDLNAKNAEALDLLIAQKDQLSAGAFDKGINAAIDALYKEGPMKVFADQAKAMLSQGKDSNFKTMLQVELASGGLDPLTVMKLVKNPNLETNYKLMVEAQGTKDTNAIFQLLMKADVGDENISVMMDIINADPKTFDKNMNALAVLANMQQKYGITIDLNDDGPEQLKEVFDITNKLSKLKGEELSKEVFFGLGVTGDMTAEEMDKLWTTLVGTSSTINKKVVTDFVAAGDKNVLDFYFASNQQIPRLRGRSAASQNKSSIDKAKAYLVGKQGAAADGTLPGEGGAGGGDGAKRNTTFDSILATLKRTRDAAIDATGGAKELMRVLGGSKDLKVFNGLDQQLSKLGANSDFIDFVGGLDNAVKEGIITINKGVVSYGKYGEAAKKAFDEKQLGLFSSKSSIAIKQLQGQRDGFVSLKAAGASSADALKMVEDADFAVSLSKAKTTEEVKKLIKQFQNERKEIEKTLRANDPQAFLKTQMDVVDQKLDLDEKIARRRYERDTQAAEDQIDLNNKIIREAERTLETDEKIGDRKVELINDQINALQRRISLEIESQQDTLDAESRQLSEDSAIISNTVDAINKKYDEQEKALSKIYEINEDIAEQEKEKLGLADAITQGDISAAARAAQEIRARNAARSGELAQEMLGRSRESEIAGVKGTITGKTSDQIAARQYQIERLSFALTTSRLGLEKDIALKQEEIYQIEVKRKDIYTLIRKTQDDSYKQNLIIEKAQEALDKELAVVKVQRDRMTDLQLAIDKATQEGVEFTAELNAAYDVIDKVSGLWNGLTDKNLKVTIQKIEEAISTGGSGSGTSGYNPDSQGGGSFDGKPTQKEIEDARKYASPFSTVFGGSAPTFESEVKKPQFVPTITIGGAPAGYVNTKELKPTVTIGGAPAGYRRSVAGLAMGGMVPKYFAAGGFTRGSDTIPAMLTPGEFVVRKNAVDNFGVNNLNKINDGSAPGNSVYNYSVDINVANSDASSSDIARAVIGQIKYIDSQRIRGQR
jgi:TP901 family phage tail tape measure protein